jgi:Uncharacterized conserved protein (DUF2249)
VPSGSPQTPDAQPRQIHGKPGRRHPVFLSSSNVTGNWCQKHNQHLLAIPNIETIMPPLNRFKRFDVRDLIRRGVEPFPEIRKRVDALKPDEGLIVVAPFLPSPLIEKLNSEGFQSRLERGHGADWIIYFWREAA